MMTKHRFYLTTFVIASSLSSTLAQSFPPPKPLMARGQHGYGSSNTISAVRLDTSSQEKDEIIASHGGLKETSERILKEAFLGAVLGTMVALPTGIIAVQLSGEEGFWGGIVPFLIGFSTGFLVGSSHGVYTVAKAKDSKVAFYKIFLAELVGFAIGQKISERSNHVGVEGFAPVVLPLVFSISYVELVHK